MFIHCKVVSQAIDLLFNNSPLLLNVCKFSLQKLSTLPIEIVQLMGSCFFKNILD